MSDLPSTWQAYLVSTPFLSLRWTQKSCCAMARTAAVEAAWLEPGVCLSFCCICGPASRWQTDGCKPWPSYTTTGFGRRQRSLALWPPANSGTRLRTQVNDLSSSTLSAATLRRFDNCKNYSLVRVLRLAWMMTWVAKACNHLLMILQVRMGSGLAELLKQTGLPSTRPL